MTPQKISIGDQVFLCEIASTPKERNQGLMFREQLNQNAGMLFDLEKEKETGFWMKNTLIPLDIIWIGKEKTVLGVQTAQPCLVDPCEIFQIKTPVRWVLEVNAGEFKGEVGDKVEFESEI
jgi:hypothetical protein